MSDAPTSAVSPESVHTGRIDSHGDSDSADSGSADSGGPHRLLHRLRAKNEVRAEELVRSFDEIVEAAADVATDDEHDPEGHTIAWERQQVAALLDETRKALIDIDAAEQRLADGTYGVCLICGSEIAAPRLEALPATPRCVHCAS